MPGVNIPFQQLQLWLDFTHPVNPGTLAATLQCKVLGHVLFGPHLGMKVVFPTGKLSAGLHSPLGQLTCTSGLFFRRRSLAVALDISAKVRNIENKVLIFIISGLLSWRRN